MKKRRDESLAGPAPGAPVQGGLRRERARTPEAKEQLREQILRHAMDLFVEAGYAGFSMRNLAQRLRFTATTLYAYYTNKDDLLRAVIGEGDELFGAYLVGASGDAVARLGSIGAAVMDFAFKHPQLYRLMFMPPAGGAAAARPSQAGQARTQLLQKIADAVRKTPLLERAGDAAVEHTVQVYWAAVHGLIEQALTLPPLDEKWARANLEFLLRALKPALARPAAA